MDGGGTDGATGLTDTGGVGDATEDAADDGSEVGMGTDPGTSDDLGTSGGFGTGSPAPDLVSVPASEATSMDDIDGTPGTGMLDEDGASS